MVNCPVYMYTGHHLLQDVLLMYSTEMQLFHVTGSKERLMVRGLDLDLDYLAPFTPAINVSCASTAALSQQMAAASLSYCVNHRCFFQH